MIKYMKKKYEKPYLEKNSQQANAGILGASIILIMPMPVASPSPVLIVAPVSIVA